MHPNVAKWIEIDRRLNETAPQKSEAWLKLRHGMLTASDAATALGCNKYEKPFDLLLKKCNLAPKFTGNDATRHGEKYEDEARIKFEQIHPELGKVWEFGVCQHPEYPFLGGSPDGVTEESNSLVEIKCPMMRDIGDGGVPEHYMPQVNSVFYFFICFLSLFFNSSSSVWISWTSKVRIFNVSISFLS